jgi:molybdopterin/thiamine biosynthesis adenylyltransferase
MRHTLTFLETQYAQLTEHLFGEGHDRERAAYLLCGLSHTSAEARLLVRQVICVPDTDLLSQSDDHLSIPASSFLPVMKKADREHASFVLVHSHPKGIPNHSAQDDQEEPGLFRTAYNRISTKNALHSSLIVSEPNMTQGRVWLDGGDTCPIDVIRIIGRRIRFIPRGGLYGSVDTSFHDRAVRAFGPDLQPLLQSLTVGVVGAGGTGSSVTEQLIRLGIGHLVVADGQALERSNVSRVYGSQTDDVGISKAVLMGRLARHLGFNTRVDLIKWPITYQSAMKKFRDCDIIFGCTDDQWGRSLLSLFSIEYCVPVFDLGVKIDSKDGVIRSIPGRVTTLMPGLPCLYCRRQITPEGVAAELLQELAPEEANERRREGYIPELPDAEPAVIAFTTATAAVSISELLNRLTGFKGEGYQAGELLIRFDESAIKKPGAVQQPGCICTDATRIGRGDQTRFLGQTWREE